MAQRLWSGATAAFNTPSNWSTGGVPGTVPQPGDTAVINAGSVSATGLLPDPLTIQVGSSPANGAELDLVDATIGRATRLQIRSDAADADLQVHGQVVNNGGIAFSGNRPLLRFAPGATSGTFTNAGGISVAGDGLLIYSVAGAQAVSFVNNGLISFHAGSTQQTNRIFMSVTGTGSLRLGDKTYLDVGQQVGAGQVIAFEPGLGSTSTLQIDSFAGFGGTITGFAANDMITGYVSRWTQVTFTPTATGATLTFTGDRGQGGVLHFDGVFSSLSDFDISQDSGTASLSQTTIHARATLPEVAARFTFNDTVTATTGADGGTVYSGPVSYLNYQYLWQGNNDAVLVAAVNNVFLRGGNGTDALKVQGGNNVIDGAGGSNFLIGGTGSDGGADTFFVDGRGGAVTWSTIVNFHIGNAVTIFGFTGGRSTLPFTDGDGAAGFTGATIHSELGGAGTGVNGSVTFAGFTVADVRAKFSISTGTVGGIDYLQITDHG